MKARDLREATKEVIRAARVDIACMKGEIRDPEFVEFAREQLWYCIRKYHQLKDHADSEPPAKPPQPSDLPPASASTNS